MEASDDLDHVGDRGYNGKWSDSGHILNTEQTAFAERLNVGYEREKRAEDDTNISGLRN